MKYGKAQFKKRLKQFSAQWIDDTDEIIVSTLKGYEDDFHTYGIDNDYLTPKDTGKRIEYYATHKLIGTIIHQLRETTRVF
jgi:hypothetical protein